MRLPSGTRILELSCGASPRSVCNERRYNWKKAFDASGVNDDLKVALEFLENVGTDRRCFYDGFDIVTKNLFATADRHEHNIPRLDGAVNRERVPLGEFEMVGTDSQAVRDRFPEALPFVPGRSGLA